MRRHIMLLTGVLSLAGCSEAGGGAATTSASAAPPSAVPYVPTAKRSASAASSATASAAPLAEAPAASILGAELMKAGFADPRSAKQQALAFEKLFQDADVAAARNALVEKVSTDEAIKPHIQDVMTQALKNDRVVAEVKKLAVGAKDDAEVSERLRKHIETSMSASAVDEAVNTGLFSMLDAAEVVKALDGALAGADSSGALAKAFEDPDVRAVEEAASQRLAAAQSSGSGDAYLASWREAAKKDPAIQTAATDVAVAAFDAIPSSKEMKAVFVGGLSGDRTKTILTKAFVDVLAEPEIKALVIDVFVAVLGDPKNAKAIAAAADKVVKHEKFRSRIQAAMVEILGSKAGTLALQRAIASTFASEASASALKAYTKAFLSAAPPAPAQP